MSSSTSHWFLHNFTDFDNGATMSLALISLSKIRHYYFCSCFRKILLNWSSRTFRILTLDRKGYPFSVRAHWISCDTLQVWYRFLSHVFLDGKRTSGYRTTSVKFLPFEGRCWIGITVTSQSFSRVVNLLLRRDRQLFRCICGVGPKYHRGW